MVNNINVANLYENLYPFVLDSKKFAKPAKLVNYIAFLICKNINIFNMKWLETIFNRVGYYSARFPLTTIAISIVVTAICSIGFKDLGVENDPQKIWVSPSSRSYKEQQYFNDKFGKFFRIN